MPYCAFDEGTAVFDATPVENMFITEYMLSAPGDYVKVYLYALMLCRHPQERMSDASMARDLGMTEEDVAHAFKYWEHSGLVRQTGDNPKTYAMLSAKQIAARPAEQLYHRAFMDSVREILGRELTAGECQKIFDWVDVLELPEEVVLMLLQTEKKNSTTKRISLSIADHTAKDWARSGIRTVEDVERIVVIGREREQQLRRLLARLGQSHRDPSADEKELYRKWLDDWGMTPEAIQEACRETTKGVPTMAYLDGILLRMYQKGLREAAELQAQTKKEQEERDFGRQIMKTLGRVGVTPNDEELSLIRAWRAAGAGEGLILLAAQTAHRRAGGGNMEEVGGVLERWRASGLVSEEDVRRESERVRGRNRTLREIFEAAGIEKRPGPADRERLATWEGQGATKELILLAAEYAKQRPEPLAAMGRILSDWNRAGITDPDAARAEHARHAAGTGSAGQPSDYLRRQYTDEDYRRMEVNLDEEGAGA